MVGLLVTIMNFFLTAPPSTTEIMKNNETMKTTEQQRKNATTTETMKITVKQSTGQPTPPGATAQPTKGAIATAKPTEELTDEPDDHLHHGEGNSFKGELKMNEAFTKDLEDQNSEAFKKLKTRCETAIKDTLSNGGIDGDPVCYKFTEGSVIMHYR